jgi:hypothetical protein
LGSPLSIAAFIPEFSALLIGIGSVLIAIGIGYLVVSYRLMKGKAWAWSITLILSYLSIAVGIASLVAGNVLSVIHMIISVVIICISINRMLKGFLVNQQPQKFMNIHEKL